MRCKNLYEDTKKSFFFLYSEQEAKKSSNDAISIMWAWLRQIPKNIRYLVIWADNCVGQICNNIFMTGNHGLKNSGEKHPKISMEQNIT